MGELEGISSAILIAVPDGLVSDFLIFRPPSAWRTTARRCART